VTSVPGSTTVGSGNTGSECTVRTDDEAGDEDGAGDEGDEDEGDEDEGASVMSARVSSRNLIATNSGFRRGRHDGVVSAIAFSSASAQLAPAAINPRNGITIFGMLTPSTPRRRPSQP
jgi:hypothetical protein